MIWLRSTCREKNGDHGDIKIASNGGREGPRRRQKPRGGAAAPLGFGRVFRPFGRDFGFDLAIGGISGEKRVGGMKFTSIGGRKFPRCGGGWRRSASGSSSPASGRRLGFVVWCGGSIYNPLPFDHSRSFRFNLGRSFLIESGPSVRLNLGRPIA